ncbi:MAG: protein rep [Planctomycetota bacterium]
MSDSIEQPHPAELQLYAKATMSERAAEQILPRSKQQFVPSNKLARAAAFHTDTELQRQQNAAAKAALRAAHAEVDKAERRAARDAQSYLIHEGKVSAVAGAALDPAHDSTHDSVHDRLERMASARAWSLGMASWLDDQDWRQDQAENVYHRSDKLRTCGSYLVFRELVGLGENRLARANFCQQPKLCPMCAMRRAAKEIQAHAPVVIQQAREQRLVPYMLTLTVKGGDDLAERLTHLRSAWKALLGKRRKSLAGSRGHNRVELSKAAGGRYSIEIKRGRNSGQWHPHLHAVLLCDLPIDQERLSDEWRRVTGDSFIVDVRPMHNHEQAASCTDPIEAVQLLAQDLVEVLKYPLKFGSMTHADTWLAYGVANGKRLASSFGCLWGVEVDDSYLDEPILPDEWPYVEVIARWMFDGYVLERGDDWTHNDDADEYMRYQAIHSKAGRFSEAKALANCGDAADLLEADQASPQCEGATCQR